MRSYKGVLCCFEDEIIPTLSNPSISEIVRRLLQSKVPGMAGNNIASVPGSPRGGLGIATRCRCCQRCFR